MAGGAARASPPQLVYAALVLALVVPAHVSLLVRAEDTLAADRPLSGDAKLVSRGGKFALGFFQPGIHFYAPSTLLVERKETTADDNGYTVCRVRNEMKKKLDKEGLASPCLDCKY